MKRVNICAALVFASSAFATETATLPEVQVTEQKLQPLPSPGNFGLDEKGLARQRTNTSDTAKMLDGQPGVSVYGAGGVSSLPVIHGMADDRVRVKVDGMDLISACPNHMNSPLSYIDPTNVGSVKVFAGIAPVSMGGDSIGGTIQVNSAPPEFAGIGQGNNLRKGQAGIFYRSNGNAQGGNLSATIASETASLMYAGSIAQSDNYKAANAFKASAAASVDKPWHWLPGDEAGSTAYKSENQSLGFALRNTNHLVELKAGVQHIPYELYPNQRMDMLSNNSLWGNLRYAGQFDWGALEARAYQETVKHYMDFGIDKQFLYGAAPLVAPGMPMYTAGQNTGVLVKGNVLLSERDIVRLGGEAQRYRLNDWWPPSPSVLPAGFLFGGMAPNTFWNINNGQRDRLGIFAEWEARWNPQWLSLFGARIEQVTMDTGPVQGYNIYQAGYIQSANTFNALNHKHSDTNPDLTALARYVRNDSSSFEFGYALKTRSPNLYERYAWSKHSMAMEMVNFVGDGNGYLGNSDLKPEQAHTLSATLDWHDANSAWEFKATPYYTHVNNYIDAVRCLGVNGVAVPPVMVATMNNTCGGTANNTAVNKFVLLQYANQSARLYGLDISGRMPLAKSEGWGEFSLSGVLNYVNGKNRTTGDNLYNIMPLNTRLTVEQKMGGWDNSVELQLVDAKKNVSYVRQEVKTGGYGLLNLHSSYEWKQLRFDAGIENALNKFYFMPLGGAYTGQGATMSFNAPSAPWGTPVPGMGRSVNAGVTLKF